VTVGRYRRFLDALLPDGTSRWEHPDQPANVTHLPWTDRLRKADYYTNPQYADYPATCVSWWSAYAFAAFEGKRLPTALEWEAAARGTDGWLFPWGRRLQRGADQLRGHLGCYSSTRRFGLAPSSARHSDE